MANQSRRVYLSFINLISSNLGDVHTQKNGNQLIIFNYIASSQKQNKTKSVVFKGKKGIKKLVDQRI